MQSGCLSRRPCATLRYAKSTKPSLHAANQQSARKAPLRAAAAAEAAAADVSEVPPGPDTIFQGLCSASGIASDAVKIERISRDKGTGLFAAKDIAKGQAVLR
jgi:hypothetical protein